MYKGLRYTAYHHVQVNNNGAISFTVAVSQFTPDPFPLSGSLELIAPYWADVDTRGTGIPNNVWYRQTTDATLLARAQDMIQAAFIDQGSFVPDYIFIATWDHVGYFSQGTDRVSRHFIQNGYLLLQTVDNLNSCIHILD